MIFKLKPSCKDYIWGGTKLKNEWNKKYDGQVLAETWELSTHKDGESTIVGGEHDGKKLSNVLSLQMLGTNCARFDRFPILVKYIDAKSNLSVQVHPADEYALKNENDLGKTEMWYVVDAEDGAGIFCGLKRQASKDEFFELLDSGRAEEILNFIPAKKGDSFFIPAGTIHAIGQGLTICEIQQNSNVTYRLYDYGRLGADGKPRPLHKKQAGEVSLLEPYKGFETRILENDPNHSTKLLALCNYFRVCEHKIKKETTILAGKTSFLAIMFTSGTGKINDIDFQRGDTFFAPADQSIQINGEATFLVADIPDNTQN